MSSSALLTRLQQLIPRDPSLIYVDCGARKGKMPPPFRQVPGASYIGVEADAGECARLNARGRPQHRYIQGILARAVESRTFHITRSPACASLLEPNHAFLAQFPGIAADFEVERLETVRTTTLDACLAANAVERADFIEMDVQGGELEVLTGAEGTLAHTLGLQIEVEFGEMYVGQPLFGDIDRDVRARGFELFDLSRYRTRRTSLQEPMATRGQLLWGHALYLRDARTLDAVAAARLAVVALVLELPDLVSQILTGLDARASLPDEQRAIRKAREALAAHVAELLPAATQAATQGRAVWSD